MVFISLIGTCLLLCLFLCLSLPAVCVCVVWQCNPLTYADCRADKGEDNFSEWSKNKNMPFWKAPTLYVTSADRKTCQLGGWCLLPFQSQMSNRMTSNDCSYKIKYNHNTPQTIWFYLTAQWLNQSNTITSGYIPTSLPTISSSYGHTWKALIVDKAMIP